MEKKDEAREIERVIENGDYTLSEVIHSLQREGYSEDFNRTDCAKSFLKDPKQFKIDRTFRFDNQTDPGDQSILYAISCEKLGLKGLLLNSYGIYNDEHVTQILEHLDPDYNKRNAYRITMGNSLDLHGT